MKAIKYQNKLSNKNATIDVALSLISFIDDNTHIVYCPALDLSGYGNDEFEAKQSFDVVLAEHLSYTTNKNTFWKDLKKLGWVIKKTKQQVATPPTMSQLLNTNQEFSRIFNNHPFKKYHTGIRLPAFA